MTQGDDDKGDRPREYMVLAPELLLQRNTDDEISLYDLWAILARKRNLILVVVAVALAASVAIAYLISPVYQASIYFSEPLNKDIAPLNIPEFSSGYTSDGVFKTFLKNFESRENLWELYTQKQLYKAYLDEKDAEDIEINRAFTEFFAKDLVLLKPKDKESDQLFLKASLDWKSDIEGAAMLNEYSQLVMHKTVEEFVDELQSKLAREKNDLEAKIALLRKTEDRSTKYRLTVLEENIRIARELGLNRPKTLEDQKTSRGEQNTSDVYVTLSEKQPLYYQGYELLEAEKQALLSRKDHDPFISGLKAAQDRLDYLNTITIPANIIHVAQISLEAKALGKPIKPKKKLIVALGGVLGLFLGMLLAFMSHAVAWKRYKSLAQLDGAEGGN